MIDLTKALFESQDNDINYIVQCLRTLLSTIAGTMPLDRDFGLDGECIGYPVPTAQNAIALDIIDKTEKYMPEIEVIEVVYKDTGDGLLIPVIRFTKRDGGEDFE